MSPAEAYYSAFDRELLTIYQAVRHSKCLLDSTPFTTLMDHKPLMHAFTKVGDAWLTRQQRDLAAIPKFGCTITYVPSMKNTVANALSRVEINSLHLGIHYEDLAREQAADPEAPAYRTALTALKWEDVPLGCSGATLLCDTSTGCPRPLVPLDEEADV